MKFGFLSLFLTLTYFTGFSQVIDGIRLREEASYQTNVEMTKVVVCMDDRSVWALSSGGKVFYKLSSESDFSEYSGTAAITVKDLDGYGRNEMYFLSDADRVYYFENNVQRVLNTTGITSINSIATVSAFRNQTLAGYQGGRDWLAIASKQSVHSVFRTDPLKVPVLYLTEGHAGTAEPDWKITNSGFKTIEFQFKFDANNPCFGHIDHAYYGKIDNLDIRTQLPESGPKFSPNVNCTYFEGSFNRIADRFGITKVEFWGTDKGLFVNNANNCDPLEIYQKLPNIKINDLENVHAFRNFLNRRFLMIATDEGFYYVTSVLYNAELLRPPAETELRDMEILRLPMEAGKVHSIATEIYSSDDEITPTSYQLCEKTVWLATEKGVRKLVVEPSIFQRETTYLPFVTRSLRNIFPTATVCSGTELQLDMVIPASDLGRMEVQWYTGDANYNNRQEIPGSRNKLQMKFADPGVYGFKLTDKCDGHIFESYKIVVLVEPPPNITFDPPDEMSICENGFTTFTTEYNPAYSYQWVRDDQIIFGETSNSYIAKSPGRYRVQVKNCGDIYQPSKSVNLTQDVIPEPSISRSSTKSLCYGETVTLSANEFPKGTYQWSSGETTRQITVSKSGEYQVTLKLGEGCSKSSLMETVVVNEELKLEPPPEAKICIIRNQRLKLQAGKGFKFYTWDGVEGTSSELEVTTEGQYTLEVEDENGCKATTLYVVVPYCSPLIPPNAFSPNSDGINDNWTVGGLESDPDAVIKVYNRYGVVVFEGTGLQATWNGKCKGTDAPAGTYYFAVIKKSSAKAATGSLTLIR
jgi:gliding motility-associated-like protein